MTRKKAISYAEDWAIIANNAAHPDRPEVATMYALLSLACSNLANLLPERDDEDGDER